MAHEQPTSVKPPDAAGNNNTLSVQSGEANNKLLEIVGGQLHMLAREQSRMFLGFVVLTLVVLASTAWLTWRLERLEDIFMQQATLAEQAKKSVWELKKSLNLKFSDERSRAKKRERVEYD